MSINTRPPHNTHSWTTHPLPVLTARRTYWESLRPWLVHVCEHKPVEKAYTDPISIIPKHYRMWAESILNRCTAGNTDPMYNIPAQGTPVRSVTISIISSNAILHGASANIFSPQYTGKVLFATVSPRKEHAVRFKTGNQRKVPSLNPIWAVCEWI